MKIKLSRFAKEITLILMIKVILLFAIKHAFFNNPHAPKMKLPPNEIAQHVYSIEPIKNNASLEGSDHAN